MQTRSPRRGEALGRREPDAGRAAGDDGDRAGLESRVGHEVLSSGTQTEPPEPVGPAMASNTKIWRRASASTSA